MAGEVERAAGRGIGANIGVEDSGCGTRGQLVEGTVSEQVAENFGSADSLRYSDKKFLAPCSKPSASLTNSPQSSPRPIPHRQRRHPHRLRPQLPQPHSTRALRSGGPAEDLFSVYLGRTEDALKRGPLWRYARKDALKSPNVPAVAPSIAPLVDLPLGAAH